MSIDKEIANQTPIQANLDAVLNKCIIDTNKHIQRPPVILSIKEVGISNTITKRLFSLGNFSCIIGKAKSKKTFFLSMTTSALLGMEGRLHGEMLTSKPLIVYFDTEQGEYDSYHVIKRIERMAGTKTNFKGYNLRSYLPVERCQIIERAFELWGSEIGYCVIDGVADLANGINDEDEATRVSSMLLRLSKDYNCHISTVIHQNKNDNFATGHLGSSIMKKAEIIISVNKIHNDYKSSEVRCDMSRGQDFEPFIITINDSGIPEFGEQQKKEVKMTGYQDDLF